MTDTTTTSTIATALIHRLASGNLQTFCTCGAIIVWGEGQLPEGCSFCPRRFVVDEPTPTPPEPEPEPEEEQEKPPISTLIDTADHPSPVKASHYLYLHEIECMLCSRPLGMVVSVMESPHRLYVPRQLRCAQCGGAPMFAWSPPIRRPMRSLGPMPKRRRGRPTKERAEAAS